MRVVTFAVFTLCIYLVSCSNSNKDHTTASDLPLDSLAIISDVPSDTAELRTLAAIAYNADRWDEAIMAYSRLLAIDSTEGQFYFRKAYAAARLLRDTVAMTNFQKAIQVRYRMADSYLNLGLIYMSTFDDETKAIACFEKCLELNPKNITAKSLLKGIRKSRAKTRNS